MDIKKSNSNAIIVEKEKKYGFRRFFLFSLYIMVLGAFGAVLADRVVFPRLSQAEFFKNSDFLKRAIESTTIINKTEQIVVPGDFLGQKVFEENKSSSLEIKKIEEIRGIGDKKEIKETVIFGFAITQDGMIFSPNFLLARQIPSEEINKSKFIVKNFQGEERSAELLADKSDNDVLVFKYSGDRMNIPVLAFADNVKPGEEVAIVSLDSVISAFVKSVSEIQILLNDYPDAGMDGALVLNKNGKIAGMYQVRVKENGQILSGVIPAGALKSKIEEVLK